MPKCFPAHSLTVTSSKHNYTLQPWHYCTEKCPHSLTHNILHVGKPVVPPPTSAPVVSKPATIVAPGATSRLIHPDEDISLVRIY